MSLVKAYEDNKAALLAAAKRSLPEGYSPEDLVQDVITAALEADAEHDNPRAYLIKAIRNRATNIRRDWVVAQRAEDGSHGPFISEGNLEDQVAVRMVLERLYTAEEVEVLYLVLVGGLTLRETREKYKGRLWWKWVQDQRGRLREIFSS